MRFHQEMWNIMNLLGLACDAIHAYLDMREVRNLKVIQYRSARVTTALAPDAKRFRRRMLAQLVASAVLLVLAQAAWASEIKLFSANVFTGVLDAFVGEFERSSGYKVAIVYGTAGNISGRVQSGEAGDVAIVTRPMIDQLEKNGKIAAGTTRDIARVRETSESNPLMTRRKEAWRRQNQRREPPSGPTKRTK